MIWTPLRTYALAAFAILLLFSVGQTYRISRLKTEITTLRADLKLANERVKSCNQTRDQEAKTAADSFSGLTAACSAERTIAVTQGRTIERIIHEPAPPPGAPRRIVGADELRALVGDPAQP